MTTWADIQNYLRSEYKVADDQEERMQLVFDLGEDRSQALFIFKYSLMEGQEDWVSIESVIGKVDEIDLKAILAEAGNIVCGALVSNGELLILRHSAPIENLDMNELTRPFDLVLVTADMLEQKFAGGDAW